jgi:hypothetical protein
MLLSSTYSYKAYFPNLVELSIPTIFGMYVIPFIMAVTLFNYVFKKDSVDFINALPLKRSTIYITNIVGGIFLFFLIFSVTSLLMWILSNFFDSLVIPKMMYVHYFITFFIAYVYVFITSTLALTLTGSRMVHIALTLILLFLPGFMGDFYTSLVYNTDISSAYNYPSREQFGVINDFNIKNSYILDNEQTLPYKYINQVPRATFGMYTGEVNYHNEVMDVYNVPSILKMIILSIIYSVIGFYTFVRRKMEIAEMTFKSENIHQLVKCITLLPFSLASISTFARTSSSISILIFGAIILIVYIVYDLITRRNNTHFMKSVIYFLGYILVSILIYISFSGIASFESSKKIKKDDISNIGIDPIASFDYYNESGEFSVLKYKIYDNEVINLIFDNAYKTIKIDSDAHQVALRLTLKNGKSYYFNMMLPKEEADKLFKLLDSRKDYVDTIKYIPYNDIYGVQIGTNYYKTSESEKVINLVRSGYKNKSVSDIVDSRYLSYANGIYENALVIYIYDGGQKMYEVSAIDSTLNNYIMNMQNENYITNIKNKNIDYNKEQVSIGFASDNPDSQYYYNYVSLTNDNEIMYEYVNNNIKENIDFSKYSEEEVINFTIGIDTNPRTNMNDYKIYTVFLVKNDAYQDMMNHIKEVVDKADKSSEVKGKI